MILETNIEQYLLWLPGALAYFGIMAAVVALVALVVGFLVAAVRHGPMAAGDRTYRLLSSAAVDLVHTSPRRVWAIARLALKETIRRRVWVVFVIFALVLLFAGWFLDPNSQDPAELYVDFVLWWTNLLILFLAIVLSTFSLPNDFKSKTIYTVVTKPVRSSDIVLGRILGFTAIGTLLGAIAGVRGGVADETIMRLADFVLVLPVLYVVLVLRAALPLVLAPGLVFALMLGIFVLVGWPIVARGVGAIVARERAGDHVAAARAAGAGTTHLLRRHLLPACAGHVAVQASLLLPGFILAEASDLDDAVPPDGIGVLLGPARPGQAEVVLDDVGGQHGAVRLAEDALGAVGADVDSEQQIAWHGLEPPSRSAGLGTGMKHVASP